MIVVMFASGIDGVVTSWVPSFDAFFMVVLVLLAEMLELRMDMFWWTVAMLFWAVLVEVKVDLVEVEFVFVVLVLVALDGVEMV